jgi:hypothetical protein
MWGEELVREQAIEALSGGPQYWPPGKVGQQRVWQGVLYTYAVAENGSWDGWLIIDYELPEAEQ